MIPTNEDADVIQFLMLHSAHVNAVIHVQGAEWDLADHDNDVRVMDRMEWLRRRYSLTPTEREIWGLVTPDR